MKISPLLLLPFLLSFVVPASAQDSTYLTKLAGLDIKDLMDQEVTSVLRKQQSLSKAAAAIYVITQEDIRRSGSRALPELLRMVPGITVTRLSGGTWQVTSRGFDSNGSSKLLVLIDGRSVYSPAFSGVFWDAQDIIAEDIDRIEVIRGPGAVSWGENAVNGVINVITKNSQDTTGLRVIGSITNQPSESSSVSYGEKIGADSSYRAFTKGSQRDNLKFDNGADAKDESWIGHGGFRFDSTPTAKDSLTFQGDLYRGSNSLNQSVFDSFAPPFNEKKRVTTEIEGANALLRWTHSNSSDSEFKIQTYYDRTDRNSIVFGETRDTYDLDIQHQYRLAEDHDLVYGLDLRTTSDSFEDGFGINLSPRKRTDALVNTFVQDEITLEPNRWSITPGVKLGYNDYSQFDYQPGLKLLWTPSATQTVWGSVSRAIRSPARIDEDIIATVNPSVGPNGVTQVQSLYGSKDFDAEQLLAYEIGYRSQVTKTLSADIATFYQQYNNLLSLTPGTPFIENSPTPAHEVIPFTATNGLHGYAYGFEMSTQWKPAKDFDFGLGYSFVDLHFAPDPGNFDVFAGRLEKETPQNQANFKAHWSLTDALELNGIVYYVDSITAFPVPSYIRTDVHVGYSLTNSLILDLAGQNLTSDGHREWETVANGVDVARTYYAKLTYFFR